MHVRFQRMLVSNKLSTRMRPFILQVIYFLLYIMRTNKEKWIKGVIVWYPRNGKRQRCGQIKR